MRDYMTEEEKPKVRVTFSKIRIGSSPERFKNLLKYYLIVIAVVIASEFILDFEGKLTFGINDVLVDFFAFTATLVIIGVFTLPLMNTKEYRSRSIAILGVAALFVSIQIAGLMIFYFLFPALSSLTYFYIFIISEIIYQIALNSVIRSYRFKRKFLSIRINNGIKVSQNSEGYVESIERSYWMTDSIKKIIEDKIRGRISDEAFNEAISQLNSTQKEVVLSLITGIESRLKNKHL